MKIELLQDWQHPDLGLFPAGSTVELYDDDAQPMITAGTAKQVADNVKTKRLTPEQSAARSLLAPLVTECVVPVAPPTEPEAPAERKKGKE